LGSQRFSCSEKMEEEERPPRTIVGGAAGFAARNFSVRGFVGAGGLKEAAALSAFFPHPQSVRRRTHGMRKVPDGEAVRDVAGSISLWVVPDNNEIHTGPQCPP